MKIGIFLSTLGGSPLQIGLERGLAELGHNVEPYRHGSGYDIVVAFNQAAHNSNYTYPDFPEANIPVAFVDSAEYGWWTRFSAIDQHRYRNAFSEASMASDTKKADQQARLRAFLEGRSFPYFIREYYRSLEFPACYHPIDYPLYALSGCDERPNREEYLKRADDFFVSWGLSHPWRRPITEALRGCGVSGEFIMIGDEPGCIPRLPQADSFARTRRAKTSISFDGYGSSSFRLTEVLVRSLLLRGPLSIIQHAALTDGVNCIDYQVESDGETFIGTDVCAKLKEALADQERCFRIYETGYWHCTDHLTEKATAAYLLETVARHDWSKPTPLDL